MSGRATINCEFCICKVFSFATLERLFELIRNLGGVKYEIFKNSRQEGLQHCLFSCQKLKSCPHQCSALKPQQCGGTLIQPWLRGKNEPRWITGTTRCSAVPSAHCAAAQTQLHHPSTAGFEWQLFSSWHCSPENRDALWVPVKCAGWDKPWGPAMNCNTGYFGTGSFAEITFYSRGWRRVHMS